VYLIHKMKKEFSKNKNVKSFISLIEKDLKQKKGKLLLIPSGKTKSFEDGQFSEADMEIKCTVDLSSNYWVGVLAHEYSHFIQCSENLDIWNNFQEKVFGHIDSLEDMFQNKNKKTNKRIRKKITQHIVKMELDCDKRTIKLINKYKLPVDKKDYCSKANFVLYKYLFWEEYGVWPNAPDSETNEKIDFKLLNISKLMSEEKYKSVENIPKEILNIFKNNI